MTTEDNSQDVQAEINKLLANPLANEDLLIRLGELDGALFASPTDKEKRGLRFLRNLVERLQTTICTNEFARANGQDASTQRKALAVAATIDFLGAQGAATASVLMIQIGLENVCAGTWEQHVK